MEPLPNEKLEKLPTPDQIRAEYEAIRQGVGLLEYPAGKLYLCGKNAVPFLNGLVSNDVKTLQPGDGVLAAFPNLQGKLVALARIYNTGEHLLMELDAINREKIFKNLSRFVLAGEFFIEDVSDALTMLTLQGPRAAALLETVTGKLPDTTPYKIIEQQIVSINSSVRIATHSRCGETGFDVFVSADVASQLRRTLCEHGAYEISPETFDIARIEAGAPREGVDAGENFIVLESELNDAVSYTKGCYLGQEVIARIHWRGQPAKRLRGLLIDAEQLPPVGTEIYAADEKKVGEITSRTHSLALDRFIALAYVHRYYLTPGTQFTLKKNDAVLGRAELVEPPFIKK